jgi:hypothetical protein
MTDDHDFISRRRVAHGGATASAHRSCPRSRHGGPNSTRLVPTASERRGKTLFAHLVRRQRTQRPRNIGRLACYSWLMVRSPGEALVPSSLPTAVEAAREAFPGLGWAQGVAERHNRRRGATPRAWSLRQKFKGHRPLFMGFLAPEHS